MPGPLADLRAALDACYCLPSWERLGNNHGCVFRLNSFPEILWTRNRFLFDYLSSSCLWLEWSDFLYSPGPFSDELWTLGFLCTFHALSSDCWKIVAHTPTATLRRWWMSLLPSERLKIKCFNSDFLFCVLWCERPDVSFNPVQLPPTGNRFVSSVLHGKWDFVRFVPPCGHRPWHRTQTRADEHMK